jgi:hypothetical protein
MNLKSDDMRVSQSFSCPVNLAPSDDSEKANVTHHVFALLESSSELHTGSDERRESIPDPLASVRKVFASGL